MTDLNGTCEPTYEPVRQAFAKNFAEGLDLGASVAVTRDGEPVVDLWGGDADPQGRPWAEDTVVNVYSTTKTMAATCMLMLADRGELDFSAPVSKFWPEFAQNGKENVLVSHVMSHSAGLSGFDEPTPTDLYDWADLTGRLERQAPWWTPGSKPGYHAVTQGFLQGEILRRITGRTLGRFFREEIAEPLGADFHIGLDAKEDARVGELIPPGPRPGFDTVDKTSVGYRSLTGPALTAKEPQTRAWRAAEIPAAGGIGNARSVARIHSALACGGSVDGVRLMSAAGVERALEEQIRGTDLVMGMPLVYGLGFGISGAGHPFSPNDRVIWWAGWGGSLALIDLDARLSIAFVMNRMAASLVGDPRGLRILESVYRSIGS